MPDSNPFTGRLRVRSNGVIIQNEVVLLVKIKSPATGEMMWMPPGGGVENGETLRDAARREVMEETGLEVDPVKVILISEFLKGNWHAIEYYFYCDMADQSQIPVLGEDPELKPSDQMLEEVQWIPLKELKNINLKPSALEAVLSEHTVIEDDAFIPSIDIIS